jgi:hypothetical protein
MNSAFLANPASTPLTLAELKFTAVATGETSIAFDPANSDISDPQASPLNTIYTDGSVSTLGATTVGAIALPAL